LELRYLYGLAVKTASKQRSNSIFYTFLGAVVELTVGAHSGNSKIAAGAAVGGAAIEYGDSTSAETITLVFNFF
jgi:hypothetical protein